MTVGDEITVRFGAEDASGLGGLSASLIMLMGEQGTFGLLLVRILKKMVFMKQLYLELGG